MVVKLPAGLNAGGTTMKGSGVIVLVLAALLVAMSVSAFAFAADNGVANLSAVSMLGTKINVQEEVAGVRAGESMTAFAVPPWALALLTIMIVLAAGTIAVCFMRGSASQYSYKSTPGAGGDGSLTRFT